MPGQSVRQQKSMTGLHPCGHCRAQVIAQLTDTERHAVHALSQWLRHHSTAPGDQDDLPESDEDGELAEAFTYSSRNSGAVSAAPAQHTHCRKLISRRHSKAEVPLCYLLQAQGTGLPAQQFSQHCTHMPAAHCAV